MIPTVEIRYRRPPDRLQVFHQYLVHDAPDVKVTLARAMAFPAPLRIDGVTVLEDGSDVVWFTFPGIWHDIGRFHRADGVFTGIYANILTPPVMDGAVWDTTDLFLDVWIPAGKAEALLPDAKARLLDADEFDEAVAQGWIDPTTAAHAREEADRLLKAAASGAWPPPVVSEWTRERALSLLPGDGPSTDG